MIFKVPYNLNHSMILGFYEMSVPLADQGLTANSVLQSKEKEVVFQNQVPTWRQPSAVETFMCTLL